MARRGRRTRRRCCIQLGRNGPRQGLNVKGIAFREGKSKILSADENFRAIQDFLTLGACSNLDQIEPLKCSRIESREMSEEVRRTTQQFDGKSFYES